MEQEKAIALKNLISDAYKTYTALINEKNRQTINLEEAKLRFTSEQFASYYDAFINELNSNILLYQNYRIVRASFNSIFDDITLNYSYDLEYFDKIFKSNFEVEFLSSLVSLYFTYYVKITDLKDDNYYMSPNSGFYKHFSYVLKEKTGKDLVPLFFDEFDFTNLLSNHYTPKFIKEQIKTVYESIYDFKQWQLMFDVKIQTEDGIKMKYSDEIFPNYEELCNLELDRLYKRLEILDSKNDTRQNNELPKEQKNEVQHIKPPYRWSKTDTDLIELITALFHSDSIKRRDNKPLTRKELIEYFTDIFDMQLKHAESKLSRTSERKKSRTQYIDLLKSTFENYIEEKDEKMKSR